MQRGVTGAYAMGAHLVRINPRQECRRKASRRSHHWELDKKRTKVADQKVILQGSDTVTLMPLHLPLYCYCYCARVHALMFFKRFYLLIIVKI